MKMTTVESRAQYDEGQQLACFEKILRSVEIKDFREYIRKLGLPEHIIMKELENASTDDPHLSMIKQWCRIAGSFTQKHADILEAVVKDLHKSQRNVEIEKDFPLKLLMYRRLACCLYEFMDFYSSANEWKRQVERRGLKIPNSVIEENRYNFANNLKEQKYNSLKYWVKEQKHRTALEVAEGFRKAGMYVPKSYPEEEFVEIPYVSLRPAPGKPETDGPDKPSEKKPKIMVSYCWAHPEVPRKVAAKLDEMGYKVWIDTEEMRGNMYERMAEGVDGSDIILVCMSQKYNESNHCRREACYAADCNKKIVLLNLESFERHGWLALIAPGNLYYNFVDKEFDHVFPEVLKSLKDFKVD